MDPEPAHRVALAWPDLLAAPREAGYAAGELVRPPATAEQVAEVEAAGQWVCSLFGHGWTFSPLARLRTDYRGWAGIRRQYSAQERAD